MTKPIIVQEDPWLDPYAGIIQSRFEAASQRKQHFEKTSGSLKNFASGYLYYGLHRSDSGWIFREWAPTAEKIYLVGDFNDWKDEEVYALKKLKNDNWELELSADQLSVGQAYKLHILWNGGEGFRIPAYAYRCVQDEKTKGYDAQVWDPGSYTWKTSQWKNPHKNPIIYEAHIGMAAEEEKVGSYEDFRKLILPRIAKAGYNTLQLMAVQEHPYYGSFGYHVSNFFAASSRFGTPDELKALIDEAHNLGVAVIMDLVHSHAVKNEIEGLGMFAGDPAQYFHAGSKREHVAWDSLCFDYGKDQVLHFLLSNCRFWLEEYRFDGFRFDGVTSMLYHDHGLERSFTHYNAYFDGGQDGDALIYLSLANELIHEVNPLAISIAEEMSGMPGLAEPMEKGGMGFDFRLAMGIPDYWIKLIKERADEDWNVSELFHELSSRRANEKTIGYAESHDQALVGDKTIIFRLLDKEMYWHMDKASESLIIDRGIALHKMIRLVTFSTSGGGYLNFMGNEFGHPEWIDFPREGNNWSYKYARRQWSLQDNPDLRYHWLADFDQDMLKLHTENHLLHDEWCKKLLDNKGDQVLAYERNDMLFVFNFNPSKSFTDYGIQVTPGKYELILDTDDKKYGGFGNVDHSRIYYAQRQGGVSGSNWMMLYIPARTALVFKSIPPPSIYEV